VIITADGTPRPATQPSSQGRDANQGRDASQGSKPAPTPEPAAAGASSGQGSIFSKQDREGAPAGERQATGPGTGNGQ
jgi:hypothetical protein